METAADPNILWDVSSPRTYVLILPSYPKLISHLFLSLQGYIFPSDFPSKNTYFPPRLYLLHVLFYHPSFDNIINIWPRGDGWSGWPCGVSCTSAATCLSESWVRIPMKAWVFSHVFVVCYVDRGYCDRLITRSEESYRLYGGQFHVT